jgi:hypothetical protein
VYGDRVLRRIFGPKRDEVTGYWRKLHYDELYTLHSSKNIIWMKKLRRLRWVKYVAGMENEKCIYNFAGKSLKRRPTGEDLDKRIILQWILEE